MSDQPTLPRFSYRATIACVSLEAASAQLGLRWVDVRRAAEEGLLTGVDVGTGAEQDHYRFARVALDEFARDARVLRTDAELAELIFGLAARQSGLTRRVAFTERLGISEHTVTRLLALTGERGLRLAPDTKSAKGPGGSPLIQWSELVRWVGVRRLDSVVS